MSRAGIIGVSDHGGWAVLVMADGDGILLDRRRVELVDEGLPKFRTTAKDRRSHWTRQLNWSSACRPRRSGTRNLFSTPSPRRWPGRTLGIALRQCPELPPTIGERITNYRARNVADWVMYRKALAAAAEARDWPIHCYDPRQVHDLASKALGVENLGRSLCPAEAFCWATLGAGLQDRNGGGHCSDECAAIEMTCVEARDTGEAIIDPSAAAVSHARSRMAM